MLIRVPQQFQHQPHIPALSLAGATLVEHRTLEAAHRQPVLYAEAAVSFILTGEKHLWHHDQPYVVPAGHGLLVERGVYITSEVLAGAEPYQTLIFFFPPQLVRRFRAQHPEALAGSAPPSAPIVTFASTPHLVRFWESVLPHLHRPAGFTDELLQLKFQELLWLLLAADGSGQLRAALARIGQEEPLDLPWVVEQYARQPLTVPELARLAGRSVSAFQREFRRYYGSSPHRWLTARRLEHARGLLDTTRLTAAEVSLAVGFESASHFIKAYKAHYGHTPGQHRLKIATL